MQLEANPEGVGAALERREELLAGGSTPAAAEAAGLEVDLDAPDAAAAVAAAAADTAAPAAPQPDAAAGQMSDSSARSGNGSQAQPRAQQQQQRSQPQQQQSQPMRGPQRQSSAAWDAFVAAQTAQPAPQAAPQPIQQQPGACALVCEG